MLSFCLIASLLAFSANIVSGNGQFKPKVKQAPPAIQSQFYGPFNFTAGFALVPLQQGVISGDAIFDLSNIQAQVNFSGEAGIPIFISANVMMPPCTTAECPIYLYSPSHETCQDQAYSLTELLRTFAIPSTATNVGFAYDPYGNKCENWTWTNTESYGFGLSAWLLVTSSGLVTVVTNYYSSPFNGVIATQFTINATAGLPSPTPSFDAPSYCPSYSAPSDDAVEPSPAYNGAEHALNVLRLMDGTFDASAWEPIINPQKPEKVSAKTPTLLMTMLRDVMFPKQDARYHSARNPDAEKYVAPEIHTEVTPPVNPQLPLSYTANMTATVVYQGNTYPYLEGFISFNYTAGGYYFNILNFESPVTYGTTLINDPVEPGLSATAYWFAQELCWDLSDSPLLFRTFFENEIPSGALFVGAATINGTECYGYNFTLNELWYSVPSTVWIRQADYATVQIDFQGFSSYNGDLVTLSFYDIVLDTPMAEYNAPDLECFAPLIYV